jgi:hypothetical protein
MSEANCSLTEVVKLGVVVGKATGTHQQPPAASHRPRVGGFQGSDGPRGSRAPAVCRWRPVVKPNVLRMADAVMHAATPAVENGPPLLVGGHQEQAGEAAAEFLECGLLSPVSLSSIARVHLLARWLVLFSQWYCIAGEPLPECERPRALPDDACLGVILRVPIVFGYDQRVCQSHCPRASWCSRRCCRERA